MMEIARIALAIGLVVAAGCGPIRYSSRVGGRAARAVEAARVARAETYAPYWWTRATQYLHKARELAAHADYQGANRFGALAEDAANRATQAAIEGAIEAEARAPRRPGKGVAPAKDPP